MTSGTFFNHDSLRARQARLAHHIAHQDMYWALIICGAIVFVGGVAIVSFMGTSFGWLATGLAGPFWMGAGLSRMLRDIPPHTPMETIDDVLDSDVLGVLPAEATPRQLTDIVLGLQGGQFFMYRFGLFGFLEALSSKQAADSFHVWQEAERLRNAASLPNINAATLTAALIRSVPDADQQLAHVRLDKSEIVSGLAWYNQIKTSIAAHNKRRPSGGLGRDWAFGYTPLLDRFGYNVSLHGSFGGPWLPELKSREAVLKQMVHFLSQNGRRNATLVGGLGSGKTNLVHALAKKLLDADPEVPGNLHFRQIVALDPSMLIAESKGRGDLEGLVQQLLNEALHAKNVILFLDDAELFFEDGNGAVNLSSILLPVVEGGALQLIMAMDEQRWLRISHGNPGLAQHMNRVAVPPTDEHESMIIMQDQCMMYEYQQKATYTYQSLQAAYQLSSRYMSEQVMPGRALKLLEAAAAQSENGLVNRHSVEQAIEQTQGVKVGTADSGMERQKLLNLEQLIHERMINQTHAVRVVSDALRRARAGVRNEKRPIGTFLFLGPTGVGKTELAKSVAAVFFGGEDRMVRLDLNEYVRPEDVSRMIADGAVDPHSLTAQIGKNPFSVVLLDEIEKAHPNVLNTLLQMLDEGILRDINNREVSFRDAVVIATSNAGAERIRAHIDAGEQLEQFSEQFTNELINDNVFRPELLNRFDEIVLFRPLKPEELLQVVDIILRGVNKQLATQKVSVTVDADAKRLLVESGYDPRLGARPLRRVVQRVVENIVSNHLLAGTAAPGSQVVISAADVHAMLERGHESQPTPQP